MNTTLLRRVGGWMTQPAVREWVKEHPKKVFFAVGSVIFISVAWVNYQAEYAEKVGKARAFFNIGDYATAKTHFDEAIKANPLNRVAASVAGIYAGADKPLQAALEVLSLSSEAKLGLRKASVFSDFKTRETIAAELGQLASKYPNDADVAQLQGKFAMSQLRVDDALPLYQQAIQHNPRAAEAYLGLCEIADIQGDAQNALEQCEKAGKLANELVGSRPAQYVINLANLYARQGQFQQAQSLVTQLENTPSVAFELSKIYLFTHAFDKAISLQKSTLAGFNEATAPTPAWYFRGRESIVFLSKNADKKCYVSYTLALSYALTQNATAAQESLKDSAKDCSARLSDVRDIVGNDVDILAQAADLKVALAAFEANFLKK